MRFGKSLINPWEYLTSNEVPFRAKLVTVQVLVGVGIRAAAANLCLKVPSFWLLVKNGLSKNYLHLRCYPSPLPPQGSRLPGRIDEGHNGSVEYEKFCQT